MNRPQRDSQSCPRTAPRTYSVAPTESPSDHHTVVVLERKAGRYPPERRMAVDQGPHSVAFPGGELVLR